MSEQTSTPPAAPAAETVAPTQAAAPEATPQTETTQATEQPKAIETKKEERISPKLARAKAEEAKAKKLLEQAEARFKAAEEKEKKLSRLKEAPLEILQELGTSFEDVANAVLKSGEPESEQQKAIRVAEEARQEVERLRREREEEIERIQNLQLQRAVEDFRFKISDTIKKNAEKFELVAAYEADNLVYDIVQEYFNKHNEILDPEKAAELAENFLEQRVERLVKTKKIQSRFKPQQEQENSVTLKNSDQSFSAPVKSNSAPMTREERLKRALARLKYE